VITVSEWKALLRARLHLALGARDRSAVAVLRETLAAIENAEAPPMRSAPASDGGLFAGSVPGLGAGELPRLALAPDAVVAIVEREIRDRRDAAAEYVRLGRHAEAGALSSQADMLAALAIEAS
jgi:uncharacterized protein YqeY